MQWLITNDEKHGKFGWDNINAMTNNKWGKTVTEVTHELKSYV